MEFPCHLEAYIWYKRYYSMTHVYTGVHMIFGNILTSHKSPPSSFLFRLFLDSLSYCNFQYPSQVYILVIRRSSGPRVLEIIKSMYRSMPKPVHISTKISCIRILNHACILQLKVGCILRTVGNCLIKYVYMLAAFYLKKWEGNCSSLRGYL